MKKINLLCMFAMLLIISGCGTSPEQVQENVVSIAESYDESVLACLPRIRNLDISDPDDPNYCCWDVFDEYKNFLEPNEKCDFLDIENYYETFVDCDEVTDGAFPYCSITWKLKEQGFLNEDGSFNSDDLDRLGYSIYGTPCIASSPLIEPLGEYCTDIPFGVTSTPNTPSQYACSADMYCVEKYVLDNLEVNVLDANGDVLPDFQATHIKTSCYKSDKDFGLKDTHEGEYCTSINYKPADTDVYIQCPVDKKYCVTRELLKANDILSFWGDILVENFETNHIEASCRKTNFDTVGAEYGSLGEYCTSVNYADAEYGAGPMAGYA